MARTSRAERHRRRESALALVSQGKGFSDLVTAQMSRWGCSPSSALRDCRWAHDQLQLGIDSHDSHHRVRPSHRRPEQGARTSHRSVNDVSGRSSTERPDDLHCRTVSFFGTQRASPAESRDRSADRIQQEITPQAQCPWTLWRGHANEEA